MKYQVGEIVVARHIENPSAMQFEGEEVEIVSFEPDATYGSIYQVRCPDNSLWWGAEYQFYRRNYPRQETTTWDKCVWQPSKIAV